MKFDLIKPDELKTIFQDVGELAVQLLRNHINKQQEVDGSPFPPLAPATIWAKQREGGGVAGNAKKRMKATNDFVDNAFEFEQRGEDLFIFVSKKKHKERKIANQIKAWETREAKGKKNKKPKPTESLITYEDLAKWQLRGEFDKGGQRKAGNPGADFFGLSQSDIEKLKKTIESAVYPIMEKNSRILLTRK